MSLTIPYEVYKPDAKLKAVIHLVHGAGEHHERYHAFIDFLNTKGYLVITHTHFGHGKRNEKGDRIHFDDYKQLTKEVLALNHYIKTTYPNEKHIVIAHSMGTFIIRQLMSEYKDLYDQYFLLGTAKLSKPSLRIALLLSKVVRKFKGHEYVSPFINNLSDSGIKRMQKSGIINRRHEWLTSDLNEQKVYLNDPLTKQPFTVQAKHELFLLILHAENYKALKANASSHPIHFWCGEHDGLCTFGKGIKDLYNKFFKIGYSNVHFTVYPNARHELLNEKTRLKVYDDIIKNINQYLLK